MCICIDCNDLWPSNAVVFDQHVAISLTLLPNRQMLNSSVDRESFHVVFLQPLQMFIATIAQADTILRWQRELIEHVSETEPSRPPPSWAERTSSREVRRDA